MKQKEVKEPWGNQKQQQKQENHDDQIPLALLLKKEKKQQQNKKNSIEIIREEINLEEQGTNKAQHEIKEVESNFFGFSGLDQLLKKKQKPVRKSSIEEIRDEINNELEVKENELQVQKMNREEEGKESIELINNEITQPQIQPICLPENKPINPPPGLPPKLNSFDSPFKINDFNNINSPDNYQQQLQKQQFPPLGNMKINDFQNINSPQTYQQQQQFLSPTQIIRSNSEQYGSLIQVCKFKMQNAQQEIGVNLQQMQNNTPSGLQKKKLRLESDQFMNSPQTPQTQQQQYQQQKLVSQFSQKSLPQSQLQQQNILSPFQSQQQQQQQYQFQNQKSEKRKPLILSETNLRYQGTVKFFDEVKGYGFLILDHDSSEVFFHMDDMLQPFVTKEYIMTYKQGNIIRFSFTIMHYIGKYNQSVKATEISLLSQMN